MANICRFTFDDLSDVINQKIGEIKIGERLFLLDPQKDIAEALEESNVGYVLIGVPENIGIKAKTGKSNNLAIWTDTIRNIVNIQHNKYNKGNKLSILGYLDFTEEMQLAQSINMEDKIQKKKYHSLVEKIDKEVAHLVFTVLKSGKVPIIIGGGQNNSYGAIKGSALAAGKSVNAINFDAYSHFLMTEGRHSGNSFSYAYEEGFLKNYFIFGLHENYTTKGVLDNIKNAGKNIKYNTYEQLIIRGEKEYKKEITKALQFVEKDGFGIDVDLDATTIFSGKSAFSSGFHARELRQFVHFIGKSKKVKYFHVSEGSSLVSENNSSDQVGKLISILVTDFIKSNQEAYTV